MGPSWGNLGPLSGLLLYPPWALLEPRGLNRERRKRGTKEARDGKEEKEEVEQAEIDDDEKEGEVTGSALALEIAHSAVGSVASTGAIGPCGRRLQVHGPRATRTALHRPFTQAPQG